MNKYETVFILTPVLSDDQMKETVEKFKSVLTDNGGKIENEENWGLRKLAYPIENKNTGFYTLIVGSYLFLCHSFYLLIIKFYSLVSSTDSTAGASTTSGAASATGATSFSAAS